MTPTPASAPKDGDPLPAGDAVHIMFETFRVLGLNDVVMSGQQARGPLASILEAKPGEKKPMICADGRSVIAYSRGLALVTGAPVVAIIDSYSQLLHSFRDIRASARENLQLMVVILEWEAEHDLGGSFGALNELLGNRVRWGGHLRIDSPIAETFCFARRLFHDGPAGPVILSFDVSQSATVQVAPPNWRDLNRYLTREKTDVPYQAISEAGTILREADHPVILLGKLPRDPELWSRCTRLIEAIGAQVISDARRQSPFPLGHPMHKRIGTDEPSEIVRIIRSSDVILIIEWDELPELFADAFRGKNPVNFVIKASGNGGALRNSLELSGTPAPVDMLLTVSAAHLVETLHDGIVSSQELPQECKDRDDGNGGTGEETSVLRRNLILLKAFKPALLHGDVPAPSGSGPFMHPLDYIGLGTGAENHVACSLGAARALARSGRLPVARASLEQVFAGLCELHRAKQDKTGILFIVEDGVPAPDDRRLMDAILGRQNSVDLGTEPEKTLKHAAQKARSGTVVIAYSAASARPE